MKVTVWDRARRTIRQALTENLRHKALATVITLLVFVFVRGGDEETARVTVDVEFLQPGPNDDRILMTEVPETVQLRVRGSPRVIQLIDEEAIPPISLDLTEERDGTYVIDPSQFRILPGLEVELVRPSTIVLGYERRINRNVEIVPVLIGQVEEGHHVKHPVAVEPNRVILSGPRQVVRDQADVQTEPVSVEGLSPGMHRRRVSLRLPEEHCRFDGSDQVTVSIIIEPDTIERTFSNVEVEVRGVESPAQAEPVSVVVLGVPEVIESLSQNNFIVFVDLEEEQNIPGNYRRDVQISGLDPLITVTLIPASVIVEVQRPAPLLPPTSLQVHDANGTSP